MQVDSLRFKLSAGMAVLITLAAIHGDGWQQPWTLTQPADDTLVMVDRLVQKARDERGQPRR